MTYVSPIVKKRLEEKLEKLNKLRPLPKSAVQKLREKFQSKMAELRKSRHEILARISEKLDKQHIEKLRKKLNGDE